MSKIKNIIAKEILDSRGRPTIEVELETDKGVFVDSVPSGASTGENEALELRDADGAGVLTAIKNVNEIIAPKLKAKDVLNQQEIDKIMIDLDGTENKSKLGANAILAVSLAVCRAGAASKKVPLYQHISELSGQNCKIPFAMFNILNGGRHAKNGLDIQEFMIILQKKTFMEALVSCNRVFNKLKDNIEKNFGKEHLELGDEGGFAPPVKTAEQALFLLKGASDGESDIKFALDCAASEFYRNGKYVLEGQEFTDAGILEFYEGLVKSFPIISIEDPFAEEDWNGFEFIVRQLGKKILIVGDDLTTTNIKRIKEAHNKNACSGIILKLNQIGTVSETIEASNLAKSFGWKTIVSHRSGETMDDFIADLAVGTGADFLKAGSPAKEERMVKYSRLLEIENELK
ncbi:MAG: phosphopyruvate hydratase [Candidatus Staskawiczbacteria bacterium]|nr:phosphopyruvate hydratase [Candidatus Staskawiczbacteria bacterium]